MAQAKVRYEKWSRKPLFGRRQYYWRTVSLANGKIVATGGEGYNNATERDDGLWLNMRAGVETKVIDLDAPVEAVRKGAK